MGAEVARILIVDDEEEVRTLVSRMLQGAGWEVELAINGAEALEKAAGRRPDLVILDAMLPGMDGFAVLQRLRETPDPPPVIGLTALGDYEAFSSFVRGGAVAYVAKPFQPQDLVDVCRRVLEVAARKSESVPDERRSETRRELMVGVRVLSKERGAPMALGVLVNLSSSGAQVELFVPLDLGSRVRVALHVATQFPVSFEGQVQWRTAAAQGFAHGLALVEISPEVSQRLRELFGSPA